MYKYNKKREIDQVTVGMPKACAYCQLTHEKTGLPIDLRPYGKNGAWICFDCGMSPENKEITKKAFREVLMRSEVVITSDRKDKVISN